MMDLNVLSDTQRSAGTLLSATLLEVIGLEPMIVTVLIYTFVCWSTDANANQRRPALFVETTVIGVATLQPAVNVASQRGEGELA